MFEPSITAGAGRRMVWTGIGLHTLMLVSFVLAFFRNAIVIGPTVAEFLASTNAGARIGRGSRAVLRLISGIAASRARCQGTWVADMGCCHPPAATFGAAES